MTALDFNNTRSSEKDGLSLSEQKAVDSPERLLDCCQKAIDMHAAFNQMLVCPDCKHIIKCFYDERAFKNYQRFCMSRHRKFLAIGYKGLNLVVFRSYEGYSS